MRFGIFVKAAARPCGLCVPHVIDRGRKAMLDITLVIPMYNVERYISLCLDSVRAQTLANIEAICVDDGSTDGTAQIAEQHAALDSRIRVIRKDNGGVSSARNAGIRAAAGTFVMFVDSDDCLEPQACERVLELFRSRAADVVVYGTHVVPATAEDDWFRRRLAPRDVYYEAFEPAVLFKECSHPYPWHAAVRRAFLIENDLLFDETVLYGEDEVFHFEMYPLARGVLFTSEKLYRYRVFRSQSLMDDRAHAYVKMVREHVYVVDRILRAWRQRGFFGRCDEQVVKHLLAFVVFDIGNLDQADRAACYAELGAALVRNCPEVVAQLRACGGALGSVVGMLADASVAADGEVRAEAEAGAGLPGDFGALFRVRCMLAVWGAGGTVRETVRAVRSRADALRRRSAAFRRRDAELRVQDDEALRASLARLEAESAAAAGARPAGEEGE